MTTGVCLRVVNSAPCVAALLAEVESGSCASRLGSDVCCTTG